MITPMSLTNMMSNDDLMKLVDAEKEAMSSVPSKSWKFVPVGRILIYEDGVQTGVAEFGTINYVNAFIEIGFAVKFGDFYFTIERTAPSYEKEYGQPIPKDTAWVRCVFHRSGHYNLNVTQDVGIAMDIQEETITYFVKKFGKGSSFKLDMPTTESKYFNKEGVSKVLLSYE